MASLSRTSTTINLGDTKQAEILKSSHKKYDVFMNFRGQDTRNNIADHLYLSLTEAQIKVFMDDTSLPFGEEIRMELLAAIEQSRIAITIISEDYASSNDCLKELAHILKCKETGRLTVIPIFYKVKPSDIGSLRNSFQRIQTHILRYHGTIVENWKEALKCIASMKGVVVDGTSYEGRIVRSIVEKVKTELTNPCKMNSNRRPGKKMDMDHLVGIDEKAREIMEVISDNSNDVLIVGIYGMGGIGKTTLARYTYNQLLNNFEFCSFIANARESLLGEVSVDQLLSVILEQGSSTINSTNKGLIGIRQFFLNKKVLIVLDDIDSRIEIRILMRMFCYFGSGSKIMLTTRNMGVLRALEVSQILIYELCPLDFDQSMQLFSHHAFGRHFPPDGFVEYSKFVVEESGGLPLLLEVIGSSLFGKEDVEWESTLDALKDMPFEDFEQKLMLSYQGLDHNQKRIFLDIACFPNGVDKQMFQEIETLDKLQSCSLVKMGDDNKLQMHDLLRHLGRKILQEKSTKYHNGVRINESRHMRKGIKEVFKSTPLTEVAVAGPIQVDKQGSFQETERARTTIAKGKPKVALENPWMSQYHFDESSNARKFQRVPPEVPLLYSGRTMDTSMIGCDSMEDETSLSQPIAELDRLFGEINSVLAHPRYAMGEKLPKSTQEAISLVDSFIEQINLPNAADIDFTSPGFSQALECLRQLNSFHEFPTELLMTFHSALTCFARTPEYLDQILSAKNIFHNCMRAQLAKVDEICNLKHELALDKDALQHTQREIALLEANLTSLKAKEHQLESKLNNAIPTINALFDELKRCRDKLFEAEALFDDVSTLEEHIKANHHRFLHCLHEIKSLLKRKTRI